MTAPLRSTQTPTAHTAAVAEFRCLYTPDVRKKQKKWQDGFLKFHAFNSRVMVYDQARNFLGDTYYKHDDGLHEGDELTLDKGVMVEVADAMAVTQTDLTPLFEKKPKEGPPPPSAAPARRSQPPSAAPARRFQPPSQVARQHAAPSSATPRPTAQHSRHRSLGTLLGTPRGPIGKSVPIKSPYEARQEHEREKDFAVDRPAKRQKTGHRSTDLPNNSPAPKNSSPLCAKTPDASTTPAPQTPTIPRAKLPLPSVKARDTLPAPAPASSPPVSASNRLTNVDFATKPTPAREAVRRPPPPSVEHPPSPPQHPKAKSLRLSKGVNRGTLMMCQPPPPPRSSGVSETRAVVERTRAEATAGPRRATSITSGDASAPKPRRKANVDDDGVKRALEARQTSPEDVPDLFDDDQEVIHGLMDQQLLMSRTPPLESILVPGTPEPVPLRTTPIKAAAAARNTRKITPPRLKKSEPVKPVSPAIELAAMPKPLEMPAQTSQPPRKPSPPAAAIQAVQSGKQAASPALDVVSASRSPTTSLSPRKLAALSTGGFRKKTKSATSQLTSPTPAKIAQALRNKTVTLPPHPLRANKKGPVMTTTELAAMLQKPKKKAKASVDSIDDAGDVAGISPDRNFRRVRSENDAPIPSTSGDWEERNLPKATATLMNTESKYAPSIAVESRETPAVAARKTSGLAALIKKTNPRKKFVRTQSLTVETTSSLPQETESLMVSPIVDNDVGPWSTEASDLFDWRPPRREEVVT